MMVVIILCLLLSGMKTRTETIRQSINLPGILTEGIEYEDGI